MKSSIAVSFDWDSTLYSERNERVISPVFDLLKKFKQQGNDLYIITGREDPEPVEYFVDDLATICAEGKLRKLRKIIQLGIEFHFDDDLELCFILARHTETTPIWVKVESDPRRNPYPERIGVHVIPDEYARPKNRRAYRIFQMTS